MRPFTVTKCFHRDAGDRRPGDVVVETLPFASLDAAIAWGEEANRRWGDLAYHVTSVVLDGSNFCCFSMETLSRVLPGYEALGWNEVDAQTAPTDQELFELANGAFLHSEGDLARHLVGR